MPDEPKRLLVAVPTVAGRDDHLERCVQSYERARRDVLQALNVEMHVRIYDDRPTCGHVWNEAGVHAALEGFDYLHLTADDLELRMGKSLKTALRIVRGEETREWAALPPASPVALIYNYDGAIESHGLVWGTYVPNGTPVTMTRIPMLATEWWWPIPDIHYWSDNAVSSVLAARQVPMLASQTFAFSHWWAQPGRMAAGSEQEQREKRVFTEFNDQLVQACLREEWLPPWTAELARVYSAERPAKPAFRLSEETPS